MKIEKYTPQSHTRGDHPATVQFNISTGVMRFNPKATAILELNAGDTVSFGKNEDQEWFVAKDPNGPLKCRSNKDGKSLYCNSSDQVRTIKEDLKPLKMNVNNSGFSILLGSEPVVADKLKWFELIGSSAKATTKRND